MGKNVSIDSKNRITISVLKDIGVLDEKDVEVEIVPNSMTAVIHPPIHDIEDIDMILDSLEAHKRHYILERKKLIRKNEEEE